MAEQGRRGANFGVGLAIIVVGIVLLLGTLDFFEATFWSNLAALWPLAIVAIGAYLLLHRRYWMGANASLAIILIGGVAAAGWLSAAGVDLGGPKLSIGNWGYGETGSGRPASEDRGLSGFDSIKVEGSSPVNVRVGPAHSVAVHADDNLIDAIRTEVSGSRLRIWTDRSIRTRSTTSIEVTVPALQVVEVAGSGEVGIEGLDGAELELKVAGSGEITAEGRLDELTVTVSGSGDVDSSNLEANSVGVAISGSGEVRVHAVDTLTVSISGSGDLEYTGQPNLSQNIAGSGSVRRKD